MFAFLILWKNNFNLFFFPFTNKKFFMIQQDRKEKERSESKNSVEEYIYETREKLSSDYERFILEEVNESVFLNFCVLTSA